MAWPLNPLKNGPLPHWGLYPMARNPVHLQPPACTYLHFSKLSLWHLPSPHTYWPPPHLINFPSWLLWGSHRGKEATGCSLARRAGKWQLPAQLTFLLVQLLPPLPPPLSPPLPSDSMKLTNFENQLLAMVAGFSLEVNAIQAEQHLHCWVCSVEDPMTFCTKTGPKGLNHWIHV